MRLISYSEWLNDTLYFQDPIHPDCLQQSYPIPSESLYPKDTGQFFKSAQDFPWRFDYTSPGNKDQSYLKCGIRTARHLTSLHVCQAARRATPHPAIPSTAVSLTATWLLTASSCLAGPLWLCPTASTPHTDASSQSRQQGVFGEHLLVRTPWMCLSASCATAASLQSAWFRIATTQTATPDFAELLCNIWHFGNGCHLPLPANGKE